MLFTWIMLFNLIGKAVCLFKVQSYAFIIYSVVLCRQKYDYNNELKNDFFLSTVAHYSNSIIRTIFAAICVRFFRLNLDCGNVNSSETYIIIITDGYKVTRKTFARKCLNSLFAQANSVWKKMRRLKIIIFRRHAFLF